MPIKWKVEKSQVISGRIKAWIKEVARNKEILTVVPRYGDAFKDSVDAEGRFRFYHDYPDYTGFIISQSRGGKWTALEIDRELFPAVKLDWWSSYQDVKNVNGDFLKEVRSGLTIVNGERVYVLPEVAVHGASPFEGYSYQTVHTDKLEQKGAENALQLLNRLPETCLYEECYWDAGSEITGRYTNVRSRYSQANKVYAGKYYVGVNSRVFRLPGVPYRLTLNARDVDRHGMRTSQWWGHARNGYCDRVQIYVDGKVVHEHSSLENLRVEDVQFIDFID